jgi:hypothetical protein
LEVNSQIRELVMAYFATALPMLGGLFLMRAARSAYFRWPVYSAMAMFVGVVAWNALRRQLPPEWTVTRASLLYFGALLLYVLLGFGTGVLLGRLARRKTPDDSQTG